MNLCRYVSNNPLDRLDAFGRADADTCFQNCYAKSRQERLNELVKIAKANAPSVALDIINSVIDLTIAPAAYASGGTVFVVYLGYTAITAGLDIYTARQILNERDRAKSIVNGHFAKCLNDCRGKCANSDDEAKEFYDEFKWQ